MIQAFKIHRRHMNFVLNEEFYLRGYISRYSGESRPTFRRNISPSLSGLKNNQCDTPSCLLNAGFLLGSLFIPENGGDIFHRNLSWLSPDYTTLHPRRQNCS
jgi:hypothetical protein